MLYENNVWEDKMKNQNRKIVNTSLAKAIVHAIVAPAVIFIAMLFVDKSMSLASVIGWYIFTITLYATTKEKQLTAYFYFNILKWMLAIVVFISIIKLISIVS